MNTPHVAPEDLALWVEGDLPEVEAAGVAEHLAACPACRAEAEAIRASQAWLKEGEESPFSAEERAALRAAVLAELASPRVTLWPGRAGWGALLAAAALVVLTLGLPRLRREPDRVAPSLPATAAAPPLEVTPGPEPTSAPTTPLRARRQPRALASAPAPPGIRMEFRSPDPNIRILWLPRTPAVAPSDPPRTS